MAGIRDELKTMAEGFRWGRRPMVPALGRAVHARARGPLFPTDWARTEAGTAARQVILKTGSGRCSATRSTMRVHGLDKLDGRRAAR